MACGLLERELQHAGATGLRLMGAFNCFDLSRNAPHRASSLDFSRTVWLMTSPAVTMVRTAARGH
jgi:hypothetical protein